MSRYHPAPGNCPCYAPESEWTVVILGMFGEYEKTSGVSLVTCERCGWYWATRAAYVDRLKREGIWAN